MKKTCQNCDNWEESKDRPDLGQCKWGHTSGVRHILGNYGVVCDSWEKDNKSYRPGDGPFYAQQYGSGQWEVCCGLKDGLTYFLQVCGRLYDGEACQDAVDHCNRACLEWGQKQPGWISVLERMPPAGPDVLVCYVEPNTTLISVGVAYYACGGVWVRTGTLRTFTEVITHWMPLPEPPILKTGESQDD